MFLVMKLDEDEVMVLRLMNCLYYMMIYKNKFYFYCELFICIVELGIMYCYEVSGVVLGL